MPGCWRRTIVVFVAVQASLPVAAQFDAGTGDTIRGSAASKTKQVLTWAMIEAGFQGTFALPMATEGDNRFGYSSATHTQLAGGNLLVDGHPNSFVQAEVAPPAVLDGREATRVGPWVDYTQGLLPDGWSGGPSYILGGMLSLGDKIYFTKHQWYNGSGVDWQTNGHYSGPLDGSGTASGMWAVLGDLAHHSRVGGYMSQAPARVMTDGYHYLAGLEGTSGAALGRWGPNLFAIEVTPIGGKLPSAPLICHDSEAHQPAGWWIANKVTAALWIETDNAHGVFFLVYEGLGSKWYGEAVDGSLVDPYGGYKGYHAEGWVLTVWTYHPDDLIEVYDGLREPWSVIPIERVELVRRDPGSAGETFLSVFRSPAIADLKMSLRDTRLLILEPEGYQASDYERTPLAYVFEVGGSSVVFADSFETGDLTMWSSSSAP